MVKTFGTTIVVPSSVAADGSSIFVDDDVSGNASLMMPYGASARSFLTSHELATVTPSCLKLSNIPFSPEMSGRHGGGSWDKSFLDMIGRFCTQGVSASV